MTTVLKLSLKRHSVYLKASGLVSRLVALTEKGSKNCWGDLMTTKLVLQLVRCVSVQLYVLKCLRGSNYPEQSNLYEICAVQCIQLEAVWEGGKA